ncbi:MAG: precorrin-2 C(20)-methyltransferase [Egibacteraceae bacterium]
MRLTGVGVGPGDPELVTVKAVRVLGEADQVFVPVSSSGEPGYAERVVLAHVGHQRVTRLAFTLGDDPAGREAGWDAAGDAVAEVIGVGGHAAFATIGDPNLYSTFTYLADTVRGLVPDVAIDTVPGITALQDLAARSGTVLAEGTQTLALLPFTAGADQLAAALAAHDTVVSYKGGRHLPRIREVLADSGRLEQAVFGARLGLDDELVGDLPDGPAPYLSTVIVTRVRGARGGAL